MFITTNISTDNKMSKMSKMSKKNFQFSNFLFYRQNSSKKGVLKNGQHLTLHLGGNEDCELGCD